MVGRLLFLICLLLAGCAGLRPGEPEQILKDVEIHQDALWQGRIVIDGSVKVFKGATLTISPGTDISFVRRDTDQDGLGDATLIIEGALKAEGTRARPIRFRSAENIPQPGDWQEIRVDFSREVHLRYCEITDSAYTLHAHFTRGVVEDCTIRRNIDGCRLGQASFVIRNNLYEHNQGKGINFRNSTVEVTRNIIRYNGSGIFLFENDREASIHGNNIHGNTDNFRLGDFYAEDVALGENWWGSADPAEAAATVFDQKQDPEIGRVHITAASAWIAGTGPRDALELNEAWRFETSGFIDAAPVAASQELFVVSWDGRLYALNFLGELLWARDLGDALDAEPAVDAETVYVQSWGRQVSALGRADGQPKWGFSYGPSRADDHRQGGLLRVGELLLVPAWNGTLYALDAATGASRWQHRVPQPLRAAPAWDGSTFYLAGGAGTLSALDINGGLLWEVDLGAPLLATPVLTPEGPAVVTRAGLVVAFNRKGTERWRRDLAETCYYGGLVYAGEALFLGTAGGSLWKLEAASGQPVWRRPTSGPVYATPLVRDGRLYLPDNSGTLAVYGVDSGNLLTVFQAPREIQGTPALVDSRLVFGARDHWVYALDVVETPPAADSVTPLPRQDSNEASKPIDGNPPKSP